MTAHIPNSRVLTSLYDNNYYNSEMQNFIRINISKENIDEIISIIKDLKTP